MSIKKYEEYKSTTVTWSNKIPEHWELLPTKRAFRRKKETNAGMKVGNRLALTMKGVLKRSLDDLDGLQASEYETYQIFQEGDLVFKLIDLQNIKTSRVGIVPEEGIMSPAYIRLEATGRIEPKYAYWYFMKLYHECIFNELGGGVRQTIGPEDLLSLPLTYPPKSEQHSIARFLDHETTKIDGLIAEQEKLIELLQEKRQAAISHAVTKGLNPDALMKDSRVEWLGEVPEHWELKKIKHMFYINDGNHGEEYPKADDFCDAELGVPFIRGSDFTDKTISTKNVLHITKEKNSSMRKGGLEAGDVLFMNRGDIGKTAIVPIELEGSNLNSQIAYLRSKDYPPGLLEGYLSSIPIQQFIESKKEGSVLTQMPIKDIENMTMPVPSKDEHDQILSHINEVSTTLTTAISNSLDLVSLLSERL